MHRRESREKINPQANDSTRNEPGDPARPGDPRLGRCELCKMIGLTASGMAIAARGTASVRSTKCGREGDLHGPDRREHRQWHYLRGGERGWITCANKIPETFRIKSNVDPTREQHNQEPANPAREAGGAKRRIQCDDLQQL